MRIHQIVVPMWNNFIFALESTVCYPVINLLKHFATIKMKYKHHKTVVVCCCLMSCYMVVDKTFGRWFGRQRKLGTSRCRTNRNWYKRTSDVPRVLSMGAFCAIWTGSNVLYTAFNMESLRRYTKLSLCVFLYYTGSDCLGIEILMNILPDSLM